MAKFKEITKEVISSFLSGSNPMERIIKMEIGYDDDKIVVFYRDEKGEMQSQKEDFLPFVWTKQSVARTYFNADRSILKSKMSEYGIECKGLIVEDRENKIHPRMENGYRVMFYSKIPMSFSKFMKFFIEAGRPIYPKETDKSYGLKDYIVVAPDEQHMIRTGKRFFKGYDDYDDLIRVLWDLETEGLDPTKDLITKIGIKTNKGFEKIITIRGEGEEKYNNELPAIREFFQILCDINPDVICGHNTENFDWNFIDVRLQQHGTTLFEFTAPYFKGRGIFKKKKEKVLKLGGETEYYFPTVKYGTNLTDSLHAVRRAQAIDSNMKKADLKYVTKYSKLNKPNRVYVPGKIINSTSEDTSKTYAFNNTNGKWFKITDSLLKKKSNISDTLRYQILNDGNILKDFQENIEYEIVTGEYIIDRYLLDDLYETDKVELQYNLPNFLVGKMLPVSFERACTMGTAAIWKYIMLAWSYENDLAIPELVETHKFTGGLSRLLSVGYVDRIVKLDYNSLYPSIILSYYINSPIDISGVMSALLEYILTQREFYKGLKGKFGKQAKKIKKQIEENLGLTKEQIEGLRTQAQQAETEAVKNDKLQLPLKITGNGFFGSYGSGTPFPHSDLGCAEKTTCIGRMCLRLMIYHFTKIGYKPIVGDSFTGDTPLFIKYNDSGLIDIKPISELINEEQINIDALGREYDYSKKEYKVLCRSGWVEPSYIYRHKTDKPLYRIEDNNTIVDVTEDHSLFNDKQEKIKPTEINTETQLEYYDKDISMNIRPKSFKDILKLVDETVKNGYKKIPITILNADKITKRIFAKLLISKINNKPYSTDDSVININNFTKTFVAGYIFIK